MSKLNLKPIVVTGKIIGGALKTIGTLLATMVMVGIITGCIVGCVLTTYVLNAIGAEEEISLDDIRLGYTSIIYYNDPETGEPVPLQRLYKSDNNRTWIDWDNIPDHVWQAMVAIEDKRFWTHEGVDWIRTSGSFLNFFVPMSHTTAGGGSTVHQQLIKNLTKDDEYRVDRKVREIFRALNLAQNYTRHQVLETYLNVIPFGAGTNGIESAANTYFGKKTSELTLAEAAAIVGITKFPGAYNPFVYPENNKERQEHVLYEMWNQGYITETEYNRAVKEELNFKVTEHYERIGVTQSYFVDHVIETVIADLMEKFEWERRYAESQLFEAGYQIYTTIDVDIQAHLENVYSTTANFPSIHNTEYPQSASVITDINGKILAMVGGIGEKPGNRVFNRATMAKRHPGSSIKPIGVYAVAFEYDTLYWSSLIDDYPINPDEPQSSWYPRNYYGGYLRMVTVDQAIQRSINTVAVKLAQKLGEQTVFDFMHDDLNMYNLIDRYVTRNGAVMSDIGLAPMALGALTQGVTPLEMAGAYQIFANGGYFTPPYCYTEVRDADGRIVLKADTTPRQVLSPDTAELMNKLLQRVTGGPNGTGTRGKITNMPTGGKTGTSQDDVDQWFIGFTPYYICQVWMGYDEQMTYDKYGNLVKNRINYYTGGHSYPPPVLFKSIMEPLHEGLEYKDFVESGELVSRQYCVDTGRLAGPDCNNTASGWYKQSSLPRTCNGRHFTPEEVAAMSNGGVSASDPNAGYSGEGPPALSEDDPNISYSGVGPPPGV